MRTRSLTFAIIASLMSTKPTAHPKEIIDEAVKQYKEGKIKSSLDVENFLDNLLQPLMQKLLDTEGFLTINLEKTQLRVSGGVLKINTLIKRSLRAKLIWLLV